MFHINAELLANFDFFSKLKCTVAQKESILEAKREFCLKIVSSLIVLGAVFFQEEENEFFFS